MYAAIKSVFKCEKGQTNDQLLVEREVSYWNRFYEQGPALIGT